MVPGDTLYSIAWSYGLDYRDLAYANGLSAPYHLRVGQKLTISSKHYVDREHFAKVSKWRWPARGHVVRRFGKGIVANKGIDIKGKFGESILATASGRVVYCGSGLPGLGKLIIIKHNANYLSAYAYNQSILVRNHQVVYAGEQIGRMGRHNGVVMLHFEIRRNGVPINPLLYLLKEKSLNE
ncbi:MAG: peptidoglycan DD-metalloendopeptidase family protein [Gammaproteobacteria bacterium]|nr:peptidoglycan DD-metalloendopeptidase family protein [Gammaproteobacteria bacterium]